MAKNKLRPVEYVFSNGKSFTNVWLDGFFIQFRGKVPVDKALNDAEYYRETSNAVA